MRNTTEATLHEVHAHDLLQLDSADAFVSCAPSAPWVKTALALSRTVVVRRDVVAENMIPVGVRGSSRAERCAGVVPFRNVIRVISPESLVESYSWRTAARLDQIPALAQLELVFREWKSFGVSWGPTGSIGFELATGIPVAKQESDLDLRILAMERLSIDTACDLLVAARSGEARIDVQMETPHGAVALSEYVGQPSKILLRTKKGPVLVKDPWEVEMEQ
jgi:phosphoribosyl-dephospho-CoA transferase